MLRPRGAPRRRLTPGTGSSHNGSSDALGARVPRKADLFDRFIDAGLIFVLFFTPLAFGAVEDWAKAIAQVAVLLVFSAWVVKLTWWSVPTVVPPGRRSLFGGRVLLSGIELPALLFVLVVLFQLVPLPPSVVRGLSPHTAALFARSLPGYGETARPSFADLPRWLESDPHSEAGGIPALPPDPDAAARALPPELFEVEHPAWRPLSLTPAHTRRALEVFLAHMALFVVAFNQFGSRPRVRRVLLLLVGLAGLLSILGILQNLGAGGKLYWWRKAGPHRSFGPFVSANNFAGWMEMILPVGAGLVVTMWERQRQRVTALASLVERAGRSYAGVVVLGFVTIISLGAFVLTQSRGGFLSLATAVIVAVVLYGLRGRLRWRGMIAALLMAGLGFLLVAWVDWGGVVQRYATLDDVRGDASFRSRLLFARHTLQIAADFPLAGTGFGTFQEAYLLYTPGTSSRDLARAHDDYVQLAAECGLLGTAAMIWGLIVLLARGIVPGLLRGGGAFRWPIRGLALGGLALLLHSFVDFNLQIYSNGMLFVFLCAVLLRDRAEVSSGRAAEAA